MIIFRSSGIVQAHVILVGIVVFGCSFKKPKNTLEKEHLKGKVMSITERHFIKNHSGRQDSLISTILHKYDRLGNEVAVKRTDKDLFVIKTKYSNGNATLEESYKNSKLIGSIAYKYDNNGFLLEKQQRSIDDTGIRREIFKNDKDGNPLERRDYNPRGKSFFNTVYKYDKQGNLTEETLYSNYPVNHIVIQNTHKYNSDGNEIYGTQMITGETNSLVESSVAYDAFDTHGNWIKQTVRESDRGETLIEYIVREIKYY